jgi:hypothetical protein
MRKKKDGWKPFRDLAQLYKRGVIGRSHFVLNWGLAQQDANIAAGRGNNRGIKA